MVNKGGRDRSKPQRLTIDKLLIIRLKHRIYFSRKPDLVHWRSGL
jgi:hypothetical protein